MKSPAKWDAIIVGARCAGAATAIHLARQGAKVLLLDRATFPSDTLSTHFLWPRGASYLNRLGIMEQVLLVTPSAQQVFFARDGVSFFAKTPLEDVKARLERVHGDSSGAVDLHISVRRIVLDKMLIDSAIALGVEFRSGVVVENVIWQNNRVVGVEARHGDSSFQERGRFIVGADGRHSRLAEWVGSPASDHREEATFAYWSYFSGMPLENGVMEKRGRLAVVIVPTNFNANMTLLFGPKEWFPHFRKDHTENYYRAIGFINPELEQQLRAAYQEERFYGLNDQSAFKRKPAGPGWLLIGDAACIKDQCTAIGMTHAFRDAELAAAAILKGLSDDETLAGAEFAQQREADLSSYYNFVCRSAGMAKATEEDMSFLRGIRSHSRFANAFGSMYGDSLPVDDFLALRREILSHAPSGEERPSDSGLSVFQDNGGSPHAPVSIDSIHHT
ncbi:MAG: NAD(P)/FAD-dependent oxidoreductase [Deltaproteobacteria bacterium]|nr:NAD(P)/FAD-dependent oxidoreductase [Deltaproteobacteria bacterium]MBI3295573.1 NAD(P)/FAD-dependent oxidoreductase [Deltaproteobacteria bacterium]